MVVAPGPRAKVTSIKFDLQGELERSAVGGDVTAASTLKALQSSWPLPQGAEFRNARWADGKSSTLAKLRAEGYAAASWSGTSADVDAANQSVRLTLILDSGPRYRLGVLRVEGLSLQSETTVRNLSGFSSGAPASTPSIFACAAYSFETFTELRFEAIDSFHIPTIE